ncbi:hypothetical protein ID866_4304 [Astraeus odoratus]|nr:hypothetical protein ID866_4304 [Astraeus odoratus]
MPSALATQLAASASLNASLLQDRTSKKRQTASYLFTGRDADAHDLDSIHAVAATAFTQLCALSPIFHSKTIRRGQDGSSLDVDFEQSLFSDAAKDMDRTLQTREVNANLDRTINAFLAFLGPWLLEVPTSKVLEWLVRRFRINEFNIDAVLALFLPYHESPHFIKMLSILHIPPTSIFAFLLPYKAAAKSLPKSALVKEMVSNVGIARFTAELLPAAVKGGYSHRTLLAFHAATVHDYLSGLPKMDDGILAFILPALLDPVQGAHKDADVSLCSYALLCVLSQKVRLKSAAIIAIVGTMAAQVRKGQGKSGVSTAQFVKAAVAVCSSQDEVPEFPLGVGQACPKMQGFQDEICARLKLSGVEKFILPLVRSLRNQLCDSHVSSLFSSIINHTETPLTVTRCITSVLVRLATASAEDENELSESIGAAARSLLGLVHQRHFELLRDIADEAVVSTDVGESNKEKDDKKEHKKRTNELLASFSLSHPLAQSTDVNEVVVASTDTSKDVRIDAVHKLYAILREGQAEHHISSSDMASIQSALLGRVYDPHQGVLQALYASPDLFLSTTMPITSPQKLLDSIISQLQPTAPTRAVLKAHIAFLAGPFSKAYPELGDVVQRDVLFPFLLASKAKFKTARSVWEAIEKSAFQSGWLGGCLEAWSRTSLLDGDNGREDTEEDIEKICEVNMGVVDMIAENILASSDIAQDIESLLPKLQASMPHGRALAYLVCRALLKRSSGNQRITFASQILHAMRINTLEDTGDELSQEELLGDHEITMKATIKPGGRGTSRALQASILVLISNLASPLNFSGSWLLVLPPDLLSGSGESDVSQQYVPLMQNIYILACSSASAPPTQVSTLLLQTLFLNLRESSLAFLLGVLLSASSAVDRVRTHALLHILAFLRGHSETGVDFQTVLPSLMAVLLDSRTDKRDRALLFECISLLSSATEKKHVYGLDTIYGQASSDLQYLDTKDLAIYVEAMVACRDQVVQDAYYLKVFHQRHLEEANTNHLSDLCTEESEAWPVFLATLHTYFQSNANRDARTLLASTLEQRLFTSLDLERRSEICILLLRTSAQGGEALLAAKNLLGKLLKDPLLIIYLLTVLQPSQADAGTPVGKKAKLDRQPQTVESHDLQELTILAEVLGTTDIPGSIDLVSHLLETLGKVIRSEVSGTFNTNYVCQMLTTAIERSADQITMDSSGTNLAPNTPGFTDNPQTFNAALLLMANLARLSPDSVLHNVMSIFTFMGSNVFHRDDSYSFRVVQSTINNIVPVMVSALRDKFSKGLELYLGSREFLRIFTDAFHHVPRHRRQKSVLGPQEFLAPLCMLLVDKVANRAVRQSVEEAQTTLSLPMALLRHFPYPVQVFVLCEVIRECLRLTSRLSGPSDDPVTFLDYIRDEEHSTSSTSVLKRRVQVLLLFASGTLVPVADERQLPLVESSSTKDLISLLVSLATTQVENDDLVTITSAAQVAIARVTNVISAGEFLSAVEVMLQSVEPQVNIGALSILSERIPLITESVRSEYKATMIQIIGHINEVISRLSAGTLAEAALAALKAIASTYSPGEEVALKETLPHILKAMRSRASVTTALAVLPCYIHALGPRMIPYFKEIVEECRLILRENLEDQSHFASTGEPALAVLRGLLTSFPAFYGPVEAKGVVKLYIEYSSTFATPSNPLTTLMKALAKRAAPDVLLRILYELWPNVSKEQTKEDVNGLIGYFTILKQTLKSVPRPEVVEQLRQISKVFMEAFDVKMSYGFTEGESHVISAFIELVVKLNESTFRPLFRRLHDWAFVDHHSGNIERKITFCRIYTALLDYFKALMNPYMLTLLRSLTEVLQSFVCSTAPYSSLDATLWSGVMQILSKSFTNDNGVIWREDNISAILPHLISQLPTATRLPMPTATLVSISTQTHKQLLTTSLVSLVTLLPAGASDALKKFNLSLLMHTRSEDARLRVFALECATEVWKVEGAKLIGFVAETATFVAECAEDENDSVVREAHKLKDAVESVAGSIHGL